MSEKWSLLTVRPVKVPGTHSLHIFFNSVKVFIDILKFFLLAYVQYIPTQTLLKQFSVMLIE